MAISWEQALAWRMRRQFLIERAPSRDFVKVVDRLCGMHAQLLSSVELGLWARVEGLKRDALTNALWKQRKLVKLWVMRSTLHVVPAASLHLFVAACGVWKPGVWPLKQPEEIRLARYVDKALRGKILSREELVAAVDKLGATHEMIKSILGTWSSALKPASYSGSLCFGPAEGQQQRFTHPATWLKKPLKKLSADKAFATLTARYLAAYGPATARDLGHWWGINQGQAKRRLALLSTEISDELSQVTIDGERFWMLAKDVAELEATKPIEVVRLLPAFDQWVTCASRHVPALLDPKYRQRIYRLQGWVSPVVLVNGRMAGIWKHELKGTALTVEIEPFAPLPRWTREPIAAEAERLAHFLGGNLSLKLMRS